MLTSHTLRWQHLWSVADIGLQNRNSESQFILRLHIFHLLQTTSPHTIDRDVGVPSRGWHGEAYRGHILWDELFIFPFITLRMPELARSLLMYRYRRLDEARHLAKQAGYAGAMFPWQSGSDGREESQVLHLNPRSGRWIPDNSNLQRHVSAAIAFNAWQYFQVTNDTEFLAYYGGEMILEIARFWASIATYTYPHLHGDSPTVSSIARPTGSVGSASRSPPLARRGRSRRRNPAIAKCRFRKMDSVSDASQLVARSISLTAYLYQNTKA